jgi:hypothetical protein
MGTDTDLPAARHLLRVVSAHASDPDCLFGDVLARTVSP